ncbi:MAG: NAD(P)H-hydrate dehydratase [Atopobiaceae bacterium]|nr:NAD(P)H-hydrate dehydratase [Atopobiaceae bacterium]
MQPVLNIEDVRLVEDRLAEEGVSISELMHRAGLASAREVMRMGDVHEVTILVGHGNNGGDGWVASEELMRRGIVVHLVSAIAPEDIKSDLARVAAQSAEAAGVEITIAPSRQELDELLSQADAVLDAIFGTGFHGEPAAPFDIWIECLNASGARVVSVDVPSGLSAQTGHAKGVCVAADVTITMLALKPGLITDEGRDMCGAIIVAPLARQTEHLVIEADPVAWRAELADYLAVMPQHSNAVDKFTRGSVLVVGGSSRFPGAPMMAAMAAARAGAGYVTLAVPDVIAPIVQSQMLEVPVVALPSTEEGMFAPEAEEVIVKLAQERDAVLVGPGMRVSSGGVGVVSALLRTEVPLVIDADGLNCLSRLTENHLDEFPELIRRSEKLVLTPHRGELGRMVGLEETPPDSLTSSLEAARRVVWADGGSEICIVAKGSATACVGVEAAVLPKPGSSALATAGSGDVLAGIMAALLSQTMIDDEDLPVLCSYACEVHGYAGTIAAERYGSHGVIARDIIDSVGIATDTLAEHITFPELAQQG